MQFTHTHRRVSPFQTADRITFSDEEPLLALDAILTFPAPELEELVGAEVPVTYTAESNLTQAQIDKIMEDYIHDNNTSHDNSPSGFLDPSKV